MSDAASNDLRPGLVSGQPAWKKLLLALSLLTIVGGGALYGAGRWSERDADKAPTAPEPSARHARGSSFLEPTVPDRQANEEAKTVERDWKARYGPWMIRVGVSFVLGFVIGFALRQFIKMLAILAAIGVALAAVAWYMKWIDIDLAAAKTQYAGALDWLKAQGGAVKDFLIGYLPSVSAGSIGAFIGFLRR